MKFPKSTDSKYTGVIQYGCIALAVTVIALYILYHMVPWLETAWHLITAVLKPLLTGCLICYLLYPFVQFFDQKLHKKIRNNRTCRSLAVLIVIVIILAAIAVLLSLLIWSAARQITQINMDTIKDALKDAENSLGGVVGNLMNYLEGQNITTSSITKKVTSYVTNALSNAAGTISVLFFGFIFAIYFLIDGKNISRYWKNAAKTLLPDKAIQVMKELASDADQCFSGYIRGQVLDAVIVGSVTTLVFLLIRMPNAPAIGLITGFGNLIPYVGPILGYASVVIINLIDFNPQMLVIGLIVLIIIMFIDGNIINPRLLANAVHVHPLLVVAALIAGGAIGGVAGMLLAVPCAAFIKMQFDKLLEKRRNSLERQS